MGFSLRNLVKHAVADINPFDGPAPQQRQAPPQPASTARPQQNPLQVRPVQQPQLAQPSFAPVQEPKPLSVGVATPQPLHVGPAVVQPNQASRSGVVQPVLQRPDVISNIVHGAGAVIKPIVQLPVQFSENYSNTFANLGNKLAGAPNQTIQQNMGGNPALDKTLQFSGATGQNKQLAGDVAQVALSTLPGAAQGAKLGAKVAINAGIGAGFGGASTAGNGGSALDTLKSAAVGGAVGGAIPLAGAVVKPAVQATTKLIDNRVPLNSAGAKPVIPGMGGDARIPKTPTPPANTAADVVAQPTTKLVSVAQPAKAGQPLQVGNSGSLVNGTAPLPEYGTKQVSKLDKAVRSTQSIVGRQGEHGKQLSGMIDTARDVKERYLSEIQKQLPTVTKLARSDRNRLRSGGDFENFVEATQGRAQPNNAKVAQAVKEWQAVHPTIRDRAVNTGLDVGDLGPQYYPHFVDYASIFKDKNMYNQSLNHLVESGQVPDYESAIALLNHVKDVSRDRQFGNLESERLADLPFYDKTPNSLISYLNGSAKRIANTEVLGAKDEKALELIAKAGQQGYDTEAMKNAYNVAVGAKQYGQTASSISGGIRKYVTTTRLGLGALTNMTQNVNTGIVTGHTRTLLAGAKQLNPKTRSFVQDTGVISDAVLNDLKTQSGYSSFTSKVLGKAVNKITAPGFGAVEKFNRSVAATAGRDYALRLAQKGDIQTLKRLGVKGDILDKTLTEEQQIQAARKIVQKTQFKVDPQDLPGWTDSPGGKLVAQFRTFSYNQSKFVSNEVLKPAAHGNVLPLGRLLAALPVGYAMYETKRVIGGRPEEDSKTKRGLAAFQNVGGAGLVFDLYQSLNPTGSKYIPTDRRTTMATGAFGGPAVGVAAQAVGALSEAVQRKKTPDDQTKLDGKVVVGKNDKYTDLTQAARFGLSQVPVVGTPIKNRLLPYKKEAIASGGASTGSPGGVDNYKQAEAAAIKAEADSKAKNSNKNISTAGIDSLAKLEVAKKKASTDLKNSLSTEDQKLRSLSKVDRKKLIDSGAYTQAKFDGLDNYVKDKKKQLGIDTGKTKSTVEVSTKIDTHSQKVLNEYNGLDNATRKKKAYGENDYDYKVAVAKYNNDKASGKISDLQDLSRKKAVYEAEVSQKYSKKVRDVYHSGISKAEKQAYFDSQPDGQQLYEQMLALDSDLHNSKLASKLKYAYGLGSGKGKGGGRKTGKGSRGGKGASLDYAKGIASITSTGTKNQAALRNLIKVNKTASSKKLNVAKVALRKQNVSNRKVRVG